MSRLRLVWVSWLGAQCLAQLVLFEYPPQGGDKGQGHGSKIQAIRYTQLKSHFASSYQSLEQKRVERSRTGKILHAVPGVFNRARSCETNILISVNARW